MGYAQPILLRNMHSATHSSCAHAVAKMTGQGTTVYIRTQHYLHHALATAEDSMARQSGKFSGERGPRSNVGPPLDAPTPNDAGGAYPREGVMASSMTDAVFFGQN